jgi:hypothetical protein
MTEEERAPSWNQVAENNKAFSDGIRQERERVLEMIEGMKRELKECSRVEGEYVCNACDSMMSCEVVECDRAYNKALSDLREKLLANKKP